MKNHQLITSSLQYLKRNWFMLSALAIILTAYFGKNIKIDLQYGTPTPEEVIPNGSDSKNNKPLLYQTQPQAKKPDKYTDNQAIVADNSISKTSIFSMFGNRKDVPIEKPTLTINASVEQIRAFINRFEKVAIVEADKYNIPASLILAQGILASHAGTGMVVQKTNNYFNIPCDEDWSGAYAVLDGSCFRQYETAWFCFRGFSNYLSNGKYAYLTKLDRTDYQRWAKGLELAGYTDDNFYAEKIIEIIEQYDLYIYDALENPLAKQ